MKIAERFRQFRDRLFPSGRLARYEASRWSRDRSTLPGYNQSARNDINAGDREELMRRARYFEKNNPLMQRVLDLIEANVVGTGINPTPSSSSDAFNKLALMTWNDWCKFADLTSRQNFYTLQGIIARGEAVDGELFVYLGEGESGRPRIQLIESHRVKSGKLPTEYKKFIDCDGILLDERGRPVYYCIQNELDAGAAMAGSVSIVPAEKIVHFFEPSRAGQYRGLTLFHAGLVTLHDLDDLQRYEMLAAKDSAERANVVYTENGELPDTSSAIGRSLRQTKDDGSTVSSEQFYEGKFGGRTVVMKRGDKWTQGEALRPSPAMREFWEYLTKQFCRSVGISYAAVEDYNGWGGAALRGAITCDNRFYEIRTQALTDGMQRIYEYVIGYSANRGELGEKPADWFRCIWQPPRRATVDIGRESKAVIEELRGGLRTFRDALGEMGIDYVDHLRQRAKEEALIDELAAEFQIDRTRISALGPNERMPANQGDAAPVTAIHAHTLEPVIAFMQSDALELPEAVETALPTSFVWMPVGTHDISAGTPSGEAWKGRVVCDEKSAAAVARDFAAATAKGRRVFLDFNHDDGAASGWVKAFSWDPARGIICSVEWSAEGEKSLRGKVYHSFSPAFLIDRENGRVAGLMIGHAAGGLVNAPAFGTAMPSLIAARSSREDTNKPAPGGSPEQPNNMKKEDLLKLLASLKVQAPADSTEEQLTALLAKHTAEVTAAQSAELARLQAVEAKAIADKKAADEVLAAKQKELDAAKAEAVTASAAKPGVVVVSPSVDSGSRITAKPNALEAVRAMAKETDARKRGEIYCAEVREFASKARGVMEILAANSLGSVSGDIIVLRSLDLLKLNFPILSSITTDFSDQQARQGQSIKTRIVGVPTVVTLNDTTGWASSDATTTDVTVSIGQPKGVQIEYTSTELAGTNRDLFTEQVEACHYALGKDLIDALYAVITAGNFTNATTKATASVARADFVAMEKALASRGVEGVRTLLANADIYERLSVDSTLVNLATYQKAEMITGTGLPPVAGFNVIRAINLPGTANLTAFGFRKDALVVATRLPEDYLRGLPGGAAHGSIGVVTNPDTGVSVQKVDFVDHKAAKAFSRIAWAYGVAKGNGLSGQRLVSA